MWDLIVSVPDHCLSFYFSYEIWLWLAQWFLRRRCWKCWQHTYIHTYIHTDRRQRHTYPISSPLSLRLRWAKTCLFRFVETSGFCISNRFTTKLVQKVRSKYSFRLAFVDVLLFNNIFELNKIEQMNCHVLFKQVHTMLCICTLEKMRSQIWWMDEFGILRPFQQYFSHIGTMEGRTWKALCNEVPSMFGKNLSSSGIRTRDPVIRSWDRSEAKSEAYYITIIQ